METRGGFSFSNISQTARKKRSDRRPRNDIQPEIGNSSLSSSPPSNNAEMGPNVGSEFRTQESSDTPISDSHNSGSLEVDSDAKGGDNVVKKVKLKVGGVTRTLHANPSSDAGASKPPQHSGSRRLKLKLISQENQKQENSGAQDMGSGLRGIPWKEFSRSGFFVGKADSVNKSKHVPKKRLLDDNDDDGDEDDDDEDDAELRYLAKMRMKSFRGDDEDEGGSRKQRKISSVLKMERRKTPRTGRESELTDYTVEDSGREMTVTTRRQALQSSKDITDATGSVVEFPHGLPPAPPRKQKDKLSEVEHQLKRAEAAQRRRIQAAKAAKESEAEAIRKILGQDSSRKKRENKMKQKQEELAQERNLNAATLTSNTVRWVIRPTGTVVTFSEDIGLPHILESRPCSYPPPREKCAGPSCSNPFKYRDSRSKRPLCSLQCYKAIQEEMQPGAIY